MKFLLKPTLAAVAVVSLLGCQQESVAEAAKAPVLDTEIQKQAYGLGASIGMYVNRNLSEQDKFGLSLDKELIVNGFIDSLHDKSALEQEEIQQLLTALDATMRTKQQEQAKLQSQSNLDEGVKYLAENGKKEGVITTDSGLQYEVLTAGDGAKPTATDRVKVHYVGTLLNGEEFDSSYKRNQPASFALNQVIKGWTEGVQLMPVGSKYKFAIPAELAYGESGTGPIPGNSTLIFEVELLEIESAPEAAVTAGDK